MSFTPPMPNPLLSLWRRLVAAGSAGGIVLMVAALLALATANSPLASPYFAALEAPLGGMSTLHWINDGLMAVFFLLVGLEIKREMLEGELATTALRILPGVAALGGMAGPALIYLAFNLGPDGQPAGWAIPSATDIAFALGALSLLGQRVPTSLKVFITALAIIDDLGAILIIALFYTQTLYWTALGAALLVLVALIALNRKGVTQLWPYLLLGAVLWYCMLRSGIHATLAGVALAATIPCRKHPADSTTRAPLLRLEHALVPWVTFGVVPLFGFANAGLSFSQTSLAMLAEPTALGIILGLFFGKQLGVFSAAALVIRLGFAPMPFQASWRQLYGVALLCGIGFTMSLFIGLLAFPGSADLENEVKLGVFLGSLLSALAGSLLLLGKGRVQPGL
ncbi:MAG TPA: Na+/H+ antiporter NhaA [Hyphomicrobiales bacterium]|nr:Na+/H+ antiporter NhaA [Hyphomicrobiales bacterium]